MFSEIGDENQLFVTEYLKVFLIDNILFDLTDWLFGLIY